MLPRNRVKSPVQEKITLVDRVQGRISTAPVLARPVLMILAVALLPWLLAPVSVYQGLRSRMASMYVAAFGAWLFFWACDSATAKAGHGSPWYFALIGTPFVVALIAHLRPLSRSVPCRHVAWALLWAELAGIAIVFTWPDQAVFAAITTWIIAAAVLGWRAAKALQDVSMYGAAARTARDGNERPRDGGQAEAGSRAGQPAAGDGGRAHARVRDARPGGRPGVRRPCRAPAAARRAPPAPADLRRGRHGRARRDDRAGGRQGAGPLDRRLDRGGPPPRRRRGEHRQADAALRVPRPARHRQDHGRAGDREDLLRLRPA